MREIDAIDMLHYNESIHFEDPFLKMDPLVEPDPMEWPNDLFALQQVRRTQFGWLLVKQLWPCPRGQLPSCSTPPPLLAVCLGNTMGNECGIGGEGKEEGRTDGRAMVFAGQTIRPFRLLSGLSPSLTRQWALEGNACIHIAWKVGHLLLHQNICASTVET